MQDIWEATRTRHNDTRKECVDSYGATALSVYQHGVLVNPDRDLPPTETPPRPPHPGSSLKFTSQQSGSAGA